MVLVCASQPAASLASLASSPANAARQLIRSPAGVHQGGGQPRVVHELGELVDAVAAIQGAQRGRRVRRAQGGDRMAGAARHAPRLPSRATRRIGGSRRPGCSARGPGPRRASRGRPASRAPGAATGSTAAGSAPREGRRRRIPGPRRTRPGAPRAGCAAPRPAVMARTDADRGRPSMADISPWMVPGPTRFSEISREAALLRDVQVTGHHHVERVARVALAEQQVAGRQRRGSAMLASRDEILVGELREQRCRSEGVEHHELRRRPRGSPGTGGRTARPWIPRPRHWRSA